MATIMSKIDVLDLGDQFIEIDKNHDGFIDSDEFR